MAGSAKARGHAAVRYSAAATDPGNAHLTFVRLASRRDIARFSVRCRAAADNKF
jgi:hypothetical protein